MMVRSETVVGVSGQNNVQYCQGVKGVEPGMLGCQRTKAGKYRLKGPSGVRQEE